MPTSKNPAAALVLLFCLAFATAGVSSAHAQSRFDYFEHSFDSLNDRPAEIPAGRSALDVAGVAMYGTFAVFSLGLSVADIVSYASDSPWSNEAAALDIVFGALNFLGALPGIITMPLMDFSAFHGASLVHFAMGSHLLAHGIWSLATNDRSPVTARITPDGASLQVQGTF